MVKTIAYLGPTGTNSETVALAYAKILEEKNGEEYTLSPYPTIAQTLYSVAEKKTDLAVVPVENSIQGTVVVTIDTIWELDQLQIQESIVFPIIHSLLSEEKSLQNIEKVYSHPQALGQCQKWLEHHLPQARLVATNSTTEAVQIVKNEGKSAAIAAPRAAELYQIPSLITEINDYPDNCTRFWVIGLEPSREGDLISLGFSFAANIPGVLVKPLQIFAQREINLTRIESRPTKRSLGEYLFFLDLEGDMRDDLIKTGLQELSLITKELKIFGNYRVLKINS